MKAVNLIPNEQQRGPAQPATAEARSTSSGGSAFGAYAILGGLAFAVAATGFYVTTNNKVAERKAELVSVESQAEAAKTQAATFQAYADFKNLADSRVVTVRSLADSRFDWAGSLDDLSRALPSDVFVSSLNASTTSANGGGSLRSAIQAPAIDVAGCTKNQASVARLMSRLRNVRGVTRVSLASSQVTDGALTTAAAPVVSAVDGEAAPKTYSLPCPDGSPPTFALTAFFERSTLVAAAVPNVSASTGAVTGATGAVTGPTGATGATTPASTTTTP